MRGSLRSELHSREPRMITRIHPSDVDVSRMIISSGVDHHKYSNAFQNSTITMQLEDGHGQAPDGPVSFVYSIFFTWSLFIHLGQDPPSHLRTLEFRKSPPKLSQLCDHKVVRLIRGHVICNQDHLCM